MARAYRCVDSRENTYHELTKAPFVQKLAWHAKMKTTTLLSESASKSERSGSMPGIGPMHMRSSEQSMRSSLRPSTSASDLYSSNRSFVDAAVNNNRQNNNRQPQLRPSSSTGGLHRPLKGQRHFTTHARDQQTLQQMVQVLVHAETKEGQRAGNRLQAHTAVEQAQMYACCMQELTVLVGSHSETLSQLCGTLWHGFVGLFKRALSAEEAMLAEEVVAHRRSEAMLKEAQSDARHFEAEAGEWRERAMDLQAQQAGGKGASPPSDAAAPSARHYASCSA